MDQLNEKTNGCVLYRSIVEAAEELEKDQALELLLTYAHIGLGDKVDLEKCDKVVRLILKQSIPSLQAAERRRQASVDNGKKGKPFGSRGGRPRKGETKEEAYDRRNIETPRKPLETPNSNIIDTLENPYKTPRKPLETPNSNIIDTLENPYKTPKKPLEKEKEYELEKDKENNNINNNNITKEEFINKLKELSLIFIRKHQDYNYLYDIDNFKENYYDNICRFRIYVNDCLNTDLSIEDCCILLLEYFQESINQN